MPKALPVLVCVSLLTAGCSSGSATAPEERGLAVTGYVTVDLNPTYGHVTLLAPGDLPLIAAPIDNGQYQVSWPVEVGSVVCGEYRVLVTTREDARSRSEIVTLSASTGGCVVPTDARSSHRVDLDFPRDRGEPPPAPTH